MDAQPRHSDAELIAAVSVARSWRGTLRELGLPDSSSAATKQARARADAIGLSYAHFTGHRPWTEPELRAAVSSAVSWAEVFDELGAHTANLEGSARNQASRLRLNTRLLDATAQISERCSPSPDISNIGKAGTMLAAAWFAMCGWDVSWPLEPARFDLLASQGRTVQRMQVKTTTVRASGTWKVYLSTARKTRRTYDVSEIDVFFVITAELEFYLVPLTEVAGLHAIHLSAYEQFRLPGFQPPTDTTKPRSEESDRG